MTSAEEPVAGPGQKHAEWTPQQVYDEAMALGFDSAVARNIAWPDVSFCGHTIEEGCTGHGDF